MKGWVANLSNKIPNFRSQSWGESSFRRILLWRILLLSIPVLLLGQYVTYKKARSSLLETARQNLTESAIRKGESIDAVTAALASNLQTASETTVLQSGSPSEIQQYLEQLQTRLPTQIQCVQLNDINTGAIAASTCNSDRLFPAQLWSQTGNRWVEKKSGVQIQTLVPKTLHRQSFPPPAPDQLRLLSSVPVFSPNNQPRYALTVESTLRLQDSNRPKSLSGYTVILDQNGTILAHRYAERVGSHIDQIRSEEARSRLHSIIRNAISGRQDFLHVASFDDQGVELVTGYTAIPSPTTTDADNRQWVILAVARLDYALFGLQEILQTLVYLLFGLIIAYFLATLYVARELARPLEKLEQYAQAVEGDSTIQSIPPNFKIRELNKLAQTLNGMIARLKAWADEIEAAWKEAKTANQLKSEFLANTSHELRTPLNAIIGCIRLVRDECCDDREEEMEFLQRADDAAVHLLQIINDVLDIAKIEAGTLSVILEPVDLKQMLQEVIDLQKVQIQHKGLQLNLPDFQGALLGNESDRLLVHADPAKLKQVLLNVIGNAVKFTDTGSISIDVRLEPAGESTNGSAESASKQATISITDTGVGIEPSQQSKLFQPFVMADGTTTRRFEGTGLGLAISRNLIEMMKGRIALFSAGLGQGTTVEIRLNTIERQTLDYSQYDDPQSTLDSFSEPMSHVNS
ncbi:HAMP domain-containing protein [Desertifilum sp. FACHB-1129]|uniref:Circadian input-output histidine kinase CikA n=1 Tax=Desertifilum tharense IPPAS B-1220 TaxID=1781255 RepID=A0A1E5QF53_9CYAN|nr:MULTISPECIES: ATP-binding protein [Desertifilum]MBD2311452.1 HAMP domain-containing protein [Desertifilum sp. FACHB-1129]MBD2323376.1 HAMP domain-containing protein [Desertifilum sp. FACHB-866]MBD2333221.1 HAMP domain-containing protein [Desertifilum sp. FACHB-868]OEJ73227.1 two-component sensor histidine kinase [Desertifilum tharense IPPAS B-1220]